MARKEGRFVGALGRYRLLIAGATLVALVALFGLVGRLVVPEEMAEVGAGRPAKPPSAEHLLGTDQQGRDVLADLIYGTPTSLEIGVIAGVVGVTLGALMGLIAGYAGGIVDEVIRVIVDILLTIPSLMILIIVASMLGVVSVEAMALTIAGPDLLLGHNLRRPDPPDVVVVPAAHRYHGHHLPRTVPDEPGPGPDREPQAPEQSVIPGTYAGQP
jgi:ABC-type dipeptide/oligopeptide/nickel transport system permease subunit